MERMLKKLFSIAALLSMVAVQANTVTPTLVLRSQGFHGDRQKWVGEVGHTHLYDMESWYGTFDVAVGYMRSFRDDRLAACLFGTDLNCADCPSAIKIQGSGVASRDPKAWLADYLYLACDFDGQITLAPRIQNVVVDLDFYLGMDEWANGLYFRAYGPVNWSKWQTGFCFSNPETVTTTSCAAGYLTPSGSETLLSSVGLYFAGGSTGAPASVDNVTFQPLKFAKMPNCDETKTGFADLRMILGWDFLQDEDYHLGLYVAGAAPTGNKRNASYVMQPVVGNGNHWELGGGLTGNYVFWRSEDEEKHFGFYLDVALSHLFKAKEQRTFDLKEASNGGAGNNSRYMLAARYNAYTSSSTPYLRVSQSASAVAGTIGTAAIPNRIFAYEYAPVANLTTLDVDVSVGVQADVVAMFNFTSRGFSWDIGYNFWGRSCESMPCPAGACDDCNPQNIVNGTTGSKQYWGLKGDARMFGYDLTDPAATRAAQAIPLSATNSAATIHGGTNITSSTALGAAKNANVDSARFAYGDLDATTNNILSFIPSADGGTAVAANQISSSLTPVIINPSNDIAYVETKGISNKVFTHLSYTWDRDNWVPYLGIGGSAEFGKAPSCGSDCDTDCATSSCSTSCDDCVSCALSQWAVWVKGGLSFN